MSTRKNKKKLQAFPCKCGHPKNVHLTVGAPIWDTYCDGDVKDTYSCSCGEYQPDNLKYLEQRYKENKNVSKRGKSNEYN